MNRMCKDCANACKCFDQVYTGCVYKVCICDDCENKSFCDKSMKYYCAEVAVNNAEVIRKIVKEG